jgi:hypothetical protein
VQCKVGLYVIWYSLNSQPLVCSISVSPNGWTDQELGLAWLERDFDPATCEKAGDAYRLLILDGHKSHCTYHFCVYGADHKILIVCLPSHTTHAMQPCDVGVFGPLAQAWKHEVTEASQTLTAITKENILVFYDRARRAAMKADTIRSSFRKTGIWPLDREAIPPEAFEPAKTTTTLAAQPLPARLPSLLTPTPNLTTPTSSAAASVLDLNGGGPTEPDGNDGGPIDEPVQRYHIEVPEPLRHTASRVELRNEIRMLREIIARAGIALEKDYAQMKLMDLENEKLRKRAFAREARKKVTSLTTGQARHMTANDTLEILARQDWEKAMKDVFKELAPHLKVLKKTITLFYQNLEKEKKAAERVRKADERRAKKAAADAEKMARRGRGRGRGRGQSRGRGGGRGRAADSRLESEGSDDALEPASSSQESSSEPGSSSASEAEALSPRPRTRPIRVIRPTWRAAEAAQDHIEDEGDAPEAHQRPRSRSPLRARTQGPAAHSHLPQQPVAMASVTIATAAEIRRPRPRPRQISMQEPTPPQQRANRDSIQAPTAAVTHAVSIVSKSQILPALTS